MMKKLLVYAIPVAALILLIVIGFIVTSPSEPSPPEDVGIPAEPIPNDEFYHIFNTSQPECLPG